MSKLSLLLFELVRPFMSLQMQSLTDGEISELYGMKMDQHLTQD